MSFLSRLFGTAPDPKEALRPLWHNVVTLAREPEWYTDCGVPDTVEGRYDMITSVLALVLLRMETVPELAGPSVRLTELFVDDMDGQLREQGIGDPALGKHMGRIVSAMGGRLGAYRDGLAAGPEALEAALSRNVTIAGNVSPAPLARRLEKLAAELYTVSNADVLAGRIIR